MAGAAVVDRDRDILLTSAKLDPHRSPRGTVLDRIAHEIGEDLANTRCVPLTDLFLARIHLDPAARVAAMISSTTSCTSFLRLTSSGIDRYAPAEAAPGEVQ
jgi:hypothetical protein